MPTNRDSTAKNKLHYESPLAEIMDQLAVEIVKRLRKQQSEKPSNPVNEQAKSDDKLQPVPRPEVAGGERASP